MAVTLRKNLFSISLGDIIASSINSISQVRKKEIATRQAAFQKAVVSGMSYEAQLEFLKKQMDDEKQDTFSDPDAIEDLEGSIADTEKLARYEKVRNAYTASLNDYISGKGSLDSYEQTLNNSLANTSDPTMRAELNKLTSDVIDRRATMEKDAVENRAILAVRDGTISVIDKSIAEVTKRKALAEINGNDDEVERLAIQLIDLNHTKANKVTETQLKDVRLTISQHNPNADETLKMYGNYANTSDKGVQVTVDNVTYSSASEYWSQKQADYVYSGDYFKKKEQEMDDTTNKLKALTEFGVVPFSRFSDMDKEFDKMTTNKALSNYVNDIEVMRLRKKRDLAMNIADTVYAEFQTRLDIAEARYGKNSKQVTAIYNEYKNFRSQLTNSSGVQITGLPSFDEYEAGKSILDTVTKPKSTPAPTTADVPDTLSPKTVTTPPPYTPPELSEIKNTLTPNKETTTPPPSVTPPSINNKPNQPAQPVYTPPPPVTAPIPTTPPPSNSGGGSNIPYLTWLTPQPVTTPTPTPTPPPSNSGGGSWINSSSSSTPAPSTPAPSNPQARADQMESRGYPKK